MKKTIQTFIILCLISFILVSCSSDDSENFNPKEEVGQVEFYFDNGVNGDKLILGNTYKNKNKESLTINRFNYIISNVVFIKADGSEYKYPSAKSYFIISEEAKINTAEFKDIPVGDYTKIRFGIGVSQQRYLEGETAQQEFWDYATIHDLTWTWSTGYRFINFEGTFTTEETQTTGSSIESYNFQIHQGSNTSTDNYREVTLNLPTTARIRNNEKPSIHVIADANKIVDGTNKIVLYNNLNATGSNASIMGGENLIKIAENSLSMFKVDHVHNGSGTHH